ncbi:hypothetical protein VTK56DRAFT_4823 [Thermocarpiscus australiensis]
MASETHLPARRGMRYPEEKALKTPSGEKCRLPNRFRSRITERGSNRRRNKRVTKLVYQTAQNENECQARGEGKRAQEKADGVGRLKEQRKERRGARLPCQWMNCREKGVILLMACVQNRLQISGTACRWARMAGRVHGHAPCRVPGAYPRMAMRASVRLHLTPTSRLEVRTARTSGCSTACWDGLTRDWMGNKTI